MCSILCYAGKDVTKETMEGYLLKTKMRGPDAQQVVETEFGYLGFARLAIMGLTPDGMQPFQRDGSWVICNGEIYGFRKIKKELEERGYQFQSGSDCEVLLPLYEEYGLEMFSHLDAEYACVLYDHKSGKLIAARDQIGIRPLFYGYSKSGKIAFASEVLGVDASMTGVKQAEENAALNGLSDRVKFTCADVFELLPELEKKGEQYDVVILDPPAFTKSRSSIKNAVKGYREINLRGMKLVKDNGFLVTCSCSHFMDPELFAKTIREAAHGAHKRLRQVEFKTQAPDHPILWAAEESYYLKFYIFQVCEEL